ncbi:MAG: hypothetical protein ACI3WT_07685 [Phascolarctobacterium sp.]
MGWLKVKALPAGGPEAWSREVKMPALWRVFLFAQKAYFSNFSFVYLGFQ